ncbi:hypothetical protein [Micromonospora sp. NBC_00860]|uniref:hypothetical protein n=1 Tax=Micromonospora sp. NBC_00860 TaxID=2975980 RepID=UPI0038657804|nr:hypothetical protein OH804_05325 [Micromonospora sp. NBC_00860]
MALSLPLTLAGLTLATPEPALAAPGDSLQGTDYDRANYGGFLAESIRTCRTVVRSPDPTGCGRRTI